MRVKITNDGSGWYRDMKGHEYVVVEDTESGGLIYLINEDVVSDKSTVRYISPEDCEIIPNAQDNSELETLRARLTATEAVVTAARGLIAYRDANTLNFQLEKADDFLRPIRVALERLQEMTE